MMSGLLFVVVSFAVAVGALAIYVGNGVLRSKRSNSGQRLASLSTRDEDLQLDFSQRAIAPVMQGLGRFALRFTPNGWVTRAQKRIVWAGWSDKMDGTTWAAIRIIGMVVGVAAAFYLVPKFEGMIQIAIGGLVLFMGFFGPESSLGRAIDARRKTMERALPDIIDLLVISVEAGLGFEAAMGRVVQNVPGDLSDEFKRTLSETRVGVSRHDAFRNMAERTNVDDLNSFILSLIQADQFGVSIARMLRVQAEEMRVRRRQRIQEKAFAAPVKMIFPMLFCIFPSIFIVILGPAVINIQNNFLNR
jgi:tight adherence protein C